MPRREEIFDLWQLGDTWRQLRKLSGGLLDQQDERILKSCLEGVARSAVVEHEYIDKDYRSAYSGFYSKKFSRLPSRAKRIHFFDVPLRKADLFALEGLAARLDRIAGSGETDRCPGTTPGFLGTIVLRPTEYSRIGRTLLDPRKLNIGSGRGAQGCLARYRLHIMGHDLDVMAFPHQSQDTQLHSCAETALWSQFRYLSQRYHLYPERYPYDIALLNTDLSRGRTIPTRGLTLLQVASVIGEFGLDAVMYYRDNLPVRDDQDRRDEWARRDPADRREAIQRLLTCYIDSGMPPIVGVPGHAVVATGLAWAPRLRDRHGKGLVLASDQVAAVIVNDDNHPPYRYLNHEKGELRYSFDDIDALAVPLPSKVFLVAEEAEEIAADLVSQLGPPEGFESKWGGCLVRRVVCTSSNNYKSFRQQHRDAVAEQILVQPLPHFVWLVEYYPRKLWTRRRAILEVALDATAGSYDAAPYLWIRYPEYIVLNWDRLYGEGGVERLTGTFPETFSGFTGNLLSYSP